MSENPTSSRHKISDTNLLGTVDHRVPTGTGQKKEISELPPLSLSCKTLTQISTPSPPK